MGGQASPPRRLPQLLTHKLMNDKIKYTELEQEVLEFLDSCGKDSMVEIWRHVVRLGENDETEIVWEE